MDEGDEKGEIDMEDITKTLDYQLEDLDELLSTHSASEVLWHMMNHFAQIDGEPYWIDTGFDQKRRKETLSKWDNYSPCVRPIATNNSNVCLVELYARLRYYFEILSDHEHVIKLRSIS